MQREITTGVAATKRAAPARVVRLAGFTLVELLIVIGIIAIIVAMLMPALKRAREAALTAQCLSNVRQIGLGAQMYFNMNKGAFPTKVDLNPPTPSFPNGWYSNDTGFAATALARVITGKDSTVLPQVFICPKGPTKGEYGVTRHQYAFNNSWAGWVRGNATGIGKGNKVQQVRQPSTKVYAMDWPGSSIEQYFDNPKIEHPHHAVPGAGSQQGITVTPVFGLGALWTDCWNDVRYGRHGTRSNLQVNVLFVDGHAETLTSAEVTRQYHLAQPGGGIAQMYNVKDNMFNLHLQ